MRMIWVAFGELISSAWTWYIVTKMWIASKVMWIFLSYWLQNVFSIEKFTHSHGVAFLHPASCRKDDLIPGRGLFHRTCPGTSSWHTGDPLAFSFTSGASVGYLLAAFRSEAHATDLYLSLLFFLGLDSGTEMWIFFVDLFSKTSTQAAPFIPLVLLGYFVPSSLVGLVFLKFPACYVLSKKIACTPCAGWVTLSIHLP